MSKNHSQLLLRCVLTRTSGEARLPFLDDVTLGKATQVAFLSKALYIRNVILLVQLE